MTKLILSGIALLVLVRSLAAEEEKPRGAKELFFDSSGEVLAVDPESEECGVSGVRPAAAPRSDCERRPVSRTRADAGALGLSFWIELIEPDDDVGRQVTQSRVFRSGEKIRLHFLSNRDGVISLLQLGSSGQPSMLFPDPEKGLTDQFLRSGEDRILPSPGSWFRFDDEPGTERILVVFAGEQDELDSTLYREPRSRSLDSGLTLLASTAKGSKDLVIETETESYSEIGTYAVNVAGKPVILEIELEHR